MLVQSEDCVAGGESAASRRDRRALVSRTVQRSRLYVYLSPRYHHESPLTDRSRSLPDLANEKSTRETFDDEGFLHTGDEGYIKDECLFIVDRLKELIKANGFQVAPAELEGFLLSHPAVQDVCVIGIPDDKRGEAPKGESRWRSGRPSQN